jgi:hypothetical protein
MKKIFEFLIMLIIFYGVYSAFQKVALLFTSLPSDLWVVIASLIASALILSLYAILVRSSIIEKYSAKIKKLEKEVKEKDQEVHDAFKIKHDVEDEAEKTIVDTNE